MTEKTLCNSAVKNRNQTALIRCQSLVFLSLLLERNREISEFRVNLFLRFCFKIVYKICLCLNHKTGIMPYIFLTI